MGKFKDYKVGTRFVSEGRIVKAVSNRNYKFDCSDCAFGVQNTLDSTARQCLNHACSYRIFKLSRLNKLIFWEKKINKK